VIGSLSERRKFSFNGWISSFGNISKLNPVRSIGVGLDYLGRNDQLLLDYEEASIVVVLTTKVRA